MAEMCVVWSETSSHSERLHWTEQSGNISQRLNTPVTTTTILPHCYHHYYITSLLPPLLSHYYLSLLPYLNTSHLTVTITDTSLVLKPFPSNKKYNIYVNRYLKRSQRSVVAECTVHSSDLICNCNSGSGNILETIRGLETTDSTSHCTVINLGVSYPSITLTI